MLVLKLFLRALEWVAVEMTRKFHTGEIEFRFTVRSSG